MLEVNVMKKQVFTILFILLFATVLGGCGIFHWRGKVPNYEEQSYTCIDSSQITNIVIDNDDIPVEIHSSPNENIYFLYYLADDKSNQYDIVEKDGVLNISNNVKQNYGIFIFGDDYSSDSYKEIKLEIFVPHDYSGNLSVKTFDGNVSIYDISVENLEIETYDGNVLFENTGINESLYCKTQDGNIKGTLAGQMSEYSFKIETSDNENNINANEESKKSVELITDDGDVDVSFSQDK